MTGKQLLSKYEMLKTAVRLSTVNAFRSGHTKPLWNDFLLQAVIESVTSRRFGDIVEEFFIAPLGVQIKKLRPFDRPNNATGYVAMGDGCVVPVQTDDTRHQTSAYVYKMTKSSLQHCFCLLNVFLAAYG
jgi:hypothetical protein